MSVDKLYGIFSTKHYNMKSPWNLYNTVKHFYLVCPIRNSTQSHNLTRYCRLLHGIVQPSITRADRTIRFINASKSPKISRLALDKLVLTTRLYYTEKKDYCN